MTAKNPYRKNAHLSSYQSRQIIRYFAEDISATKTSNLLSMHRNTINSWYNYIRHIIYLHSLQIDKDIWKGIIEIDESYFGPRRVRGKKGRGALGKIKVLGLLKREEKVYVQIVPDMSAKSLLPIIRGKIDTEDSIINTDGRKSYDGLIDMGYKKHRRVIHSKDEFARGKKHINGIESCWSYIKRRLAKFNGVRKDKYVIHLKESEFRFNCRLQDEDIYTMLIKLLKNHAQLV